MRKSGLASRPWYLSSASAWLVLVGAGLVGCGTDSLVGPPILATDSAGQADGGGLDGAATDVAAGSDLASGTDVGATTDVGVGSDVLAGSDVAVVGTDVAVGTDAEIGTDAATGTDTASGTDAEAGTDTASGTDAEAGTDTASGTDAKAGTDTASGTDAETGTDTASGTDAEAGADTASGTDAEAGTDTASGTDAEAGTDTASGTDAEAGTDTISGTDATVACDLSACPTTTTACQAPACLPDGSCGFAPAVDGLACDDGDSCTSGDACLVGVCVSVSLTCDDGNPCTDDTCDPDSGQCATQANAAACDDLNACTTLDSCAAGTCAGASATACDDDNACTTDSCDPGSGCIFVPSSGPCDDGDACTSGDTCSGGLCGGLAKDCSDNNPCTLDSCSDGTCQSAPSSEGASCDDGKPCTEADVCTAGTCTGSAKVCNDGNPCTDDSCSPQLGCVAAPNTASCDDGNACTTADTCAGGKCGGSAVGCDDNNLCTDDTCDPASGCINNTNAAPCVVASACEQGTCSAGTCVGNGVQSCDDGNPCTIDTCDSATGCQYANAADGSTCGSGDACLSAATCQSGACKAGQATDCNDNNLCTDDSCNAVDGCTWQPNAKACDDGNACTVGDVCGVQPGLGPVCTSGAPVSTCSDNNPCTTDSCDSVAGCVSVAGNAGASCDDGSACTTSDACQGGQCVGTGLGACDDGNVCTTDKCDAATGACAYTAFVGACNDNNPCTTGDACGGGKCNGTAVSCTDGNVCTADSCDKASGACVFAPLSSGSCDDGSACTSADTCSSGVCGGVQKDCSDGNVCTDDSCDASTGACQQTANTAPCTSDNLCVSDSQCAASTCVAGSTAKCEDNNPCTTDSCNPANGECSYAEVDAGTPCDDGIACTTSSVCGGGSCAPTAGCTLYTSDFACNTATDWTIVTPASGNLAVPRNVKWAVDQTPTVSDQNAKGCTLNFNDGTDYCDVTPGQNGANCLRPEGTATSPLLDFTQTGALIPTLTMDSLVDIENVAIRYLNWDTPRVILRDESGATLGTWLLPARARDLNVWKNGYQIEMPQAMGKKVRIELSLNLPYNFNNDIDNKQKGWFVDNVAVTAALPVESQCGDAEDNDLDGTADCADADCASSVFCSPAKITLASGPSNACTNDGWSMQSSTAQISFPSLNWSIDTTPQSVVPKTGNCTLNFNDGTNFRPGVAGIEFDQATGGTARWSQTIDLDNYNKVALRAWVFLSVEGNGACATNSAGCDARDVTVLEISRDNFADCTCGANQTCQNAPICSSSDTIGVVVPKDNLGVWFPVVVDLSPFAGDTVALRVRFDSVTSQFNTGAGVFLDDIEVIAVP